jgi:hypothetical protein
MNFLVLSTLLVDPQTGLIAGAVLPLIMTRLIRQQPEVEVGRAVMWGASWGAMYAVSVSYMYFVYADWMFGYLVDTSKFPLALFYPVFFLAVTFSGAAGAAATAYFIKENKMVLAFLSPLGAALTLAVVWIPHWDSYSHIGTLAEWKAGTAPLMPGTGTAPMGMNGAGAIATIYSVALIVHLVRRSLKT